MSILSAYFSPWHYYPQDEDYLRRLDPAWVRIHQPTAKAIELVQRVAPNARILLRSWDIDDHNGDRKREMYADPKGAAAAHLAMWRAKWNELVLELDRNNWNADTNRWYLGLINEPDPNYVSQMVEYTLEAMRLVEGTQIYLGVVCSSVGTFSKPSENGNGWALCKPLEKPINDGGHILVCHEYWQPEGPNYGEDAGNLAWRHRSIPLNVPILIGEAGVNGYIYQRYSDSDDAGWRKFMGPEAYAAQVKEYIEGCDQRVKGVCLYMLDYHSAQWESFYTGPAAEQLIAIKDVRPTVDSYELFLPTLPTGTPPAETGVPALIHPIADPALRRITQKFGENEAYYAQFGLRGHNGTDYGIPMATPIRACADGQAVEVLNDLPGYGLYIKLIHSWGESLSAHLSFQAVRQGERVKAGQVIGLSGSTGKSTGPHLHFAMRVNPYRRDNGFNGYSDPLPYLEKTTQPADVNDLLARLITAEAGGESVLGQLAEAWVVKNRVERGGWWGNSWTEVINFPYQFAPLAPTATPVARAVADLVLQGATVDPVSGATHFHNMSVHPDWADSLVFVKQLGSHRFYK